MKLRNLGFAALLAIISTTIFAALPPKYLDVPDWKSCTSSQKKGSASFVCLPSSKPAACPLSSWKALNDGNMMNHCDKHKGKKKGSKVCIPCSQPKIPLW